MSGVTELQLGILRRIKSGEKLLIDEPWMNYTGCFYFSTGGKVNANSVHGLIRRGFLTIYKSPFRGNPKQLVLTKEGADIALDQQQKGSPDDERNQ